MKKFLAVMFAVMFAFSALAVGASAEANVNINIDGTDDKATYACPYCDVKFTSPVLRDEHVASQNPVDGHKLVCGELHIDADGKVYECTKEFEARAALAEHQEAFAVSLFNLAIAYFKNKDFENGCKFLLKALVEVLKNIDYKALLGKIVDGIKAIPFADIVGKVKDVAGKIPMDKIVDGVKGIVG